MNSTESVSPKCVICHSEFLKVGPFSNIHKPNIIKEYNGTYRTGCNCYQIHQFHSTCYKNAKDHSGTKCAICRQPFIKQPGTGHIIINVASNEVYRIEVAVAEQRRKNINVCDKIKKIINCCKPNRREQITVPPIHGQNGESCCDECIGIMLAIIILCLCFMVASFIVGLFIVFIAHISGDADFKYFTNSNEFGKMMSYGFVTIIIVGFFYLLCFTDAFTNLGNNYGRAPRIRMRRS